MKLSGSLLVSFAVLALLLQSTSAVARPRGLNFDAQPESNVRVAPSPRATTTTAVSARDWREAAPSHPAGRSVRLQQPVVMRPTVLSVGIKKAAEEKKPRTLGRFFGRTKKTQVRSASDAPRWTPPISGVRVGGGQ